MGTKGNGNIIFSVWPAVAAGIPHKLTTRGTYSVALNWKSSSGVSSCLLETLSSCSLESFPVTPWKPFLSLTGKPFQFLTGKVAHFQRETWSHVRRNVIRTKDFELPKYISHFRYLQLHVSIHPTNLMGGTSFLETQMIFSLNYSNLLSKIFSTMKNHMKQIRSHQKLWCHIMWWIQLQLW